MKPSTQKIYFYNSKFYFISLLSKFHYFICIIYHSLLTYKCIIYYSALFIIALCYLFSRWNFGNQVSIFKT